MTTSIIDISHDFFDQVVYPILALEFPDILAQTAFGVFGHGSEALRLDDGFSRDHHWGLRIDALMPDALLQEKRTDLLQTLAANLPSSFQGFDLGERTVAGAGLAPDSLEAFLGRTIGLGHPPATHAEWLNLPEEDIIHVVNGKVWHDPVGHFSEIRQTLNGYYPEPVWLRRMAHWCRYFSGMGTYALKRALLRDNELFAAISFGKAIRWGIQLAFLIERRYFPYDKWLFAYFQQLPRLYTPLAPIVDEAVSLSSSWERKLALLDQMADVLDQAMVQDGIIPPHPHFVGSPTSGYRLIEHAYKELLAKTPADLKPIIPLWDQVYLEQFVVGFVDGIDMEAWHGMLNLTPIVPT